MESVSDFECVKPSVQALLDHLHEGVTQGSVGTVEKREGSCVGVETLAALDTDGPSRSEILSRESLAVEALVNEHFNNLLPQRSQYTVSRTEMADGATCGTLGPTGQEFASDSGLVQDDSGSAVEECPICTESYHSRGDRSMALLNCDHSMCQRCLAAMLRHTADCSRVQCPLCRQKTPLLQWEIHRLQEEAVFSTFPSYPSPSEAELPNPGLCSGLEQRLLLRAETTRVCGCFEHPRRLVQLIRRMQHQPHCHCCFFTLLLILYLTELSFLLLVFLPVIVLVLLFTLAN